MKRETHHHVNISEMENLFMPMYQNVDQSEHIMHPDHGGENDCLQCVHNQASLEGNSRTRSVNWCSLESTIVAKYLFFLSFVLNLFLTTVLFLILWSAMRDGQFHNSSGETLGDAVCMPCKGIERFIPWEKWKYIHMHVLENDDEDVCCFHRSNYLQILIKLIIFAQRRHSIGDRPCHSIISSHFNLSGDASTLDLAISDGINYGSNALGALVIHQGIVSIEKSDIYQLFLQITIRFDYRESSTDFHLYIAQLGADGTNSTISHRHLTTGKSSEGIGYQTVYIFESVSLQQGDRIAVIVDNQSLVYRSFECNSIGLIGS